MLGPFRISIHAKPASSRHGETIALSGTRYETFRLNAEQQMSPMAVSFEEVVDQLNRLPRMFVEPDGSFVWTGSEEVKMWQLDGCIYDRSGRVIYVDLAGRCPASQFDRLLAVFGWPETELLIQLSQQALFLSEQDFRRYIGQCHSR